MGFHMNKLFLENISLFYFKATYLKTRLIFWKIIPTTSFLLLKTVESYLCGFEVADLTVNLERVVIRWASATLVVFGLFNNGCSSSEEKSDNELAIRIFFNSNTKQIKYSLLTLHMFIIFFQRAINFQNGLNREKIMWTLWTTDQILTICKLFFNKIKTIEILENSKLVSLDRQILHTMCVVTKWTY